MKTSSYGEDECSTAESGDGNVEIDVHSVETPERWNAAEDNVSSGNWSERTSQFVSAEDLSLQRLETQRQKWKDSQASLASSEASVQREVQREKSSDALKSPGSEVSSDVRERWSASSPSSEVSRERDGKYRRSDMQTSPPISEVSREQLQERWSDTQTSPLSAEVSRYVTQDEKWSDTQTSPLSAEVSRYVTQDEKWSDTQTSPLSAEVSRYVTQDEKWSDTQTSPPSSDVSAARESRAEWSDCRVSPPELAEDAETVTDTEPAAPCEPISELYYTASSEVSLLSDTELPEKRDSLDKEEGKCVMAGHVAAMRERFESMTRANTPCPDTMRTSSPSFDVYRNITPSPDLLG